MNSFAVAGGNLRHLNLAGASRGSSLGRQVPEVVHHAGRYLVAVEPVEQATVEVVEAVVVAEHGFGARAEGRDRVKPEAAVVLS